MNPSIGINSFYLEHSRRDRGNSFTLLSSEALIEKICGQWFNRCPGAGETTTDRKVLVPLAPEDLVDAEGKPVFFCPPRVKLVKGMSVCAEVVTRQDGEEPYVETFITPEEVQRGNHELILSPAKTVDVVMYSADALRENNGKPTTDLPWEVVTLLCATGVQEPMTPLTMARNQLEKPGGSKGEYSALEYANSVWYHATNRGLKVRPKRP